MPEVVEVAPRLQGLEDEESWCPVCGQEAIFWGTAEDHHYGNEGSWTFFRCSGCRHIFQKPMPNDDSLLGYYPSDYYAYEKSEYDFAPRGLRRRRTWLRMHHLKRSLGYSHLPVSGNALLALLWRLLPFKHMGLGAPPFKTNGVCLDYGCGSGRTVAFLAFLGWKSEGVEINGNAARIARMAGLDVEEGSAKTLESRKSRYDYIISTHCIEHVPNVKELFSAFHSALKPGGALCVEVPNGDALSLARYGELFYYLGAPVHVHLFSRRSLTLLAEAVGLEVVSYSARSVWTCHYAPRALEMRLRKTHAKGVQFRDVTRNERRLAQALSFPNYLRSCREGKGDSLVLQAMKPLSRTK